MVTFGFWVLAILGAAFLAVGIFPAYFGELVVENAWFVRVVGFMILGAAFTVRSLGTPQSPESRQD
jgi:putative exporter of polyketide antibiotics